MAPDHQVKHWAVRVSLPFDRLDKVIEEWLNKVDGVVVYQHNEANRIHCHFLLYNTKVSKVRLKQLGLLHLPGNELQRNALWSWKQLGNTEADKQTYITYMSKGKLEPEVCVGIEWKEVERYKMMWIEPQDRTTVAKALQGYLDFEKHVREKDISLRCRADDIRTYATRWVFEKHGWFSQVANNESKNYAATYIFKYNV